MSTPKLLRELATGHYYGLEAYPNVWHPNVTSTGEFSTSQVWISSSGPIVNSSTMEAGWMLDGYKTGCVNAACGFVQVSQSCFRYTIEPVSQYNGKQYETYMSIRKLPDTNWWLIYQDEQVGYWPANIFKEFGEYAAHINFGGKIYNSEPGGIHTSTQMGSGHFSSEGYGRAYFIRNIRYSNKNGTFVSPKPSAFQQLVKKPVL
ncbi:uncharacterized protein LOC115988858 isoform X1 [Quercus lobata]|uniref:uncharacterized protein LOC115988858 isoform X1 n=1 Tax=Quercus lobata TaxID=97700 RepID=UPI001247D05C|nr:uncharacterized protein LOC115988858 isoform X1 [Quercus lobata]